jgi:hypothetical protein
MNSLAVRLSVASQPLAGTSVGESGVWARSRTASALMRVSATQRSGF